MNERQWKKTRGLSPAVGAVQGFLQSHELAQALRPHMAKVKWVEVVGPQVAGVTQIEAVRDGVLYVRVKNSVWANELSLLKDDMLRRLNVVLGGRVLTDIHFKASGLAKAKKAPAKPAELLPTDAELSRIALSPPVRARVESATAGIADGPLQARIRRAMTRAAKTEEWKRRHGWLPCARCGSLGAPEAGREAGTEGEAGAEEGTRKSLCALCRARVV